MILDPIASDEEPSISDCDLTILKCSMGPFRSACKNVTLIEKDETTKTELLVARVTLDGEYVCDWKRRIKTKIPENETEADISGFHNSDGLLICCGIYELLEKISQADDTDREDYVDLADRVKVDATKMSIILSRTLIQVGEELSIIRRGFFKMTRAVQDSIDIGSEETEGEQDLIRPKDHARMFMGFIDSLSRMRNE